MRLALVALSAAMPQFPLNNVVHGGDAVGYTQLAGNLLNNGSFAFAGGAPTAFRMPGYPLFLAATYGLSHGWLLAQIVQVIADTVTVCLVYASANLVARNRTVAILAAALYALHPLIILSSISLLPESIAILASTAGLFVALRFRNNPSASIMATLAAIVAVYCKPTLLLLGLVLVIAPLLHQLLTHGSLKAALASGFLSVVVAAVLVLPWSVRNANTMGSWIFLTTSSGSNLYGGNNSFADGGYVSNEPYVLPNMSEVASDRVLANRAQTWIRQNPTDFIRLLPRKAAHHFWPLALGTSGTIAVPAAIWWGTFAVTLTLYLLALTGIAILGATRRYYDAGLLVTVILAVLIPSLVAFGAARFALPAFPAVAVLSAVGFEYVGQMSRSTLLAWLR